MPKLHALLIGINQYHPQSQVSNLDGCINDMQAVKKFLEENFYDLKPQIKTLTNQAATRENIITTFRSHISANAQPKDSVLFYYAGHGSFSTSADSFAKFDGLGQDETLVCYDSRLPGKHDLTDKEIAVLLSEITNNVHTVVIADSCHSASLTRTIHFKHQPKVDPSATFNLGKSRFTAARLGDRNMASYLLNENNYYTKLEENISIPRSKHILLSACNRNELAWETDDRRGLFTSKLLETLNEGLNISYRDLFARVRALVYGTAQNQQPTLYPYEGFDPNTVFLRPDVKPNKQRHQVKFDDNTGQWRMELGAINGLPNLAEDIAKMVVGIYEGIGDQAKFIKPAKVSSVSITDLTLSDTAQLDPNAIYWGEMQSLPTALIINLEGRKSTRNKFLKTYYESPSPYIELIPGFDSMKYSLKVTAKHWTIKITDSDKPILKINRNQEDGFEQLIKNLEHIAHWENIATLDNPDSSIQGKIEFRFRRQTGRTQFEDHLDNSITLDYYKRGADKTRRGTARQILYNIEARNTSDENLYVALLHLSEKFQVASFYSSEIIPANSDWIVLDDQHALAIEDEGIVQTTTIFKGIVSTKHFDDYKYILEEISPPKGQNRNVVAREAFEEEDFDDWSVHTMTVNVVRPQGDVGGHSFNQNGIHIEPHPEFRAELSFSSQQPTTRSAHPGNNLGTIFQGKGLELINLNNTGSRNIGQDRSIIELKSIQGAAALAVKPLVMNLDASLSEGGTVIPVTLKNGFVIPLGNSTQMEDGSTQIQINHIPDGIDPAPSTVAKRSLGRALWFSLLKIAGKKEEAFLLRKVVYRKGVAKRVPLYKSNIKKAKNILLVIHGIIGDTKSVIPNIEFLKTAGHYDLILTFDYENLNTKIEDIAKELNRQLTAFGLGVDDGKTFDILAHSMGGLVSRYLIEFLRKGDNLVDHLFMFGTPNGGSVFGEIPTYRDRLTLLLTVALNFSKAWSGWVGQVLGVVNKVLIGTKFLTKTLAQMSADSEFIEKLRDSTLSGHTKYTVIAGDISDYEKIKEARLARFVETILLKIGDTANSSEPNDIAVLVEDIRAVPDAISALKYDVCCHHLNYFESEDGLIALREIVESRKG